MPTRLQRLVVGEVRDRHVHDDGDVGQEVRRDGDDLAAVVRWIAGCLRRLWLVLLIAGERFFDLGQLLVGELESIRRFGRWLRVRIRRASDEQCADK